MKSLDTNMLLRLVLNDNSKQCESVNALFSDETQKFAVADMVFAEIVWVLQGATYQQSREYIGINVRAIMDIAQINCNREMLNKALPLFLSHPKISFIDACLTVYAELNNATPLLSFDKNLQKALPDLVATP